MKKRVLAVCLAAVTMVSLGACTSEETQEVSSASEEVSDSSSEEEEEEEEDEYTAEYVLSALSYDVEDYVVLNDYWNMDIDAGEGYTASDEEIEEQLEAFAAMYNTILVESSKTTVEDGDVVNIDYTGYLDGEEFDGGSAEDYNLEIGSDTFVDGFEDALIGFTVGETATITVTFPEDYGVDSLNGQDVEFSVTVNAILEEQEITYEEISDQWVEDNFYSSMGITTLDEFREYLSDYLEMLYESDTESDIEDQILEILLEECEITIPDGYLELRIESYTEAVYAIVEASGESFEDCMGVTEEEFEESLPENMESRVRKDLLLEALVKDMDISFSETDYLFYVDAYLNNYGYETEDELYEAAEGASELSGKEYIMLGYAEYLAWNKLVYSYELD